MRNTKDWYLFLDQLQKSGKKPYLYLERKFYAAEDSLITGIKAILAEEYSRELSKKIVNAHRHRQQNGGRPMLTGKVYGYDKQSDGTVTIDEEEAEVIRQIYQYCAAGYGTRTIANLLQEQGIRSKNGKFMTPATIRRMVRNPMSKGVVVMNKQHFDFETKRTYKNPPEEWIYKAGAIPAIVDDDLWERANEAMSRRASENHRDGSYVKGGNPGKYELSGKLVCEICGNPYYRIWRRGYADPEQVCDRYFEMTKLDRQKIIRKTVRLLKKAMKQSESGKELEKLEAEEVRYVMQKDLLLSKLLDGIISDLDYRKKNQDLEQRIQEVNYRKEKWKQKKSELEVLENRITEIQNRLEHGGLEKATVGKMLQDIDRIVVHEWYLELEYDPLKRTGLTNEQSLAGALLEEGESCKSSIRIPYPFPARTRRGRILNEIRILEALQKTPKLTAEMLAAQLDITVGMVRTRMKKLKQDGYIRYVGAGGHGSWEVLKSVDERKRQVEE